MDITKILPEVDEIRDSSLRAKVVTVWEKALKAGGWDESDLDKIPFSLLTKESGVNLITHTRAVTRASIEIAKVMVDFYREKTKIDFDILIAGGLLHDVGKLLEYKKSGSDFVKSTTGKLVRHPFSGAAMAYAEGVPESIQHIIATHAHEGDGGFRSIEAIIINHADFVNFESLGGKV